MCKLRDYPETGPCESEGPSSRPVLPTLVFCYTSGTSWAPTAPGVPITYELPPFGLRETLPLFPYVNCVRERSPLRARRVSRGTYSQCAGSPDLPAGTAPGPEDRCAGKVKRQSRDVSGVE